MGGFFDPIGGWLSAHFLGLGAAAVGLAAAVPAVVILYFLKLKRKEQVISSTLLWQRALEDLRVNAPFQRLRTNLLLLLQILILLALGLALARPFAPGAAPGRQNSFVLLIDHSASMSTTDCGGKSRLEAARRAALDLVAHMPGESRAAVIAFAATPRVLTGFTPSAAELEAAIRKIEPSGAGTDLEGALEVADGLAGAVGRDNCRVILYSDAALPANRPVKAIAAAVELHKLGGATSNAAVTALEARRVPGSASQIFARVANFGAAKVRLKARLYLGDRKAPADARDVELAAGARATLLFEVLAPAGLLPVKVELAAVGAAPDPMPVDDVAWAVLPPDRDLKILAYTADRNFLEKALAGLPGTRCERLEPSAVPRKGEAAPAAWGACDVVIFDGCAPGALPPAGGYLLINACPPLEGAALGGEIKFPKAVDWDRSHPLTRFASLEGIDLVKARPVKIGPGQNVLLESEAGPIIAAWRHEQLRVLVIGFDLYESNWPLRVSFPIFMANATRWLAEAGPSSALWAAGAQRCGEPLRLTASAFSESAGAAKAVEVRVERPDGRGEGLVVPADAPRLYSATDWPGLYRVAGPDKREALFACSVLDEAESDNSARDAVSFAVSSVRGGTVELAKSAADSSAAGREYWKYAAMAALAVFIFEWFIYNRRLWG